MKVLTLLSFRSLLKNKSKTVVTSIGILLSIILLSTILILAISFKTSLIATTISRVGDWHLFIENDTDHSRFNSLDKNTIEKSAKLNIIGYSEIVNALNNKKPYIFIASISSQGNEIMPISVTKGNFPSTDNEIIVPSSYSKLYNKDVGDSLLIDIGKRFGTEYGSELKQSSSYLGKDKENITIECQKEYIIVGISDTIQFVEYEMSPGYAFLTINDTEDYTRVYVKFNNPSVANTFTNDYSNDIVLNNDLLNILGLKKGESTGKTFSLIIVFLVFIIFLCSFILIYNSYMLTLNERSKFYSLLTSIGSTSKQLLFTTMLENCILACFIIPLGILMSYSILYIYLNKIIIIISNISYMNIVFKLNFNFKYPLMIFGIGILMILISSMLPYLINIKKNTINSLRQNEVIKIKQKKESKSKKILEFDLLFKNIKRYKSKYLFTITSIVISIVLFITMDIFCAYSIMQINEETDINYDIYTNISNYDLDYSIDNIYTPLKDIKGVTDSWWTISNMLGTYTFEKDKIDSNSLNFIEEKNIENILVRYVILENNMYENMLDNEEINKDRYNNKEEIVVPAIAVLNDYFNDKKLNIFRDTNIDLTLDEEDFIDNTAINKFKIEILTSKLPKNITYCYISSGITIFLSLDMAKEFLKVTPNAINLYFNCNNHSEVYKTMNEFKEENNIDISITDNAKNHDRELDTINIIDIFSKLFIYVVIMISLLNIFNTVFSTLIMRQKEFAILTSIGMTDKSIKKLIFFENIFVCGTAIVIGMLISIIISFLLKLLFNSNIYIYPIVLTLILIVVFIATAYLSSFFAMNKNKNLNIIETLKRDFG